MKFIFLSFKKNILPFLFLLFALFLVIFSKTNLIAAKNGLILWANNVVPSLFPFFVITELLSNTNLVYHIGKLFDKLMRPLFNVPGECAFAFIMGLISGYPTGGKIVSDLREQGVCTKEEGDRMLAFTNNSGPLFIISCVGISLFGDSKTGFLLLITHILSAITVGIIFGKLFSNKSKTKVHVSTQFTPPIKKEPLTFRNLGKLLGQSIQGSISTILIIGGFIVIFSVIISILQNSHILEYLSQLLRPIAYLLGIDFRFIKPILSGIIELTNGINMVANISIKSISQNIIICSFLLGFGGISVLLQVFSMLSKTDLSINKYILGKFLQGIIAAFYTFLTLKFFPSLNLDVVPTCVPIAETIVYPINLFGLNSYILLMLVLFFIVFVAFSHKDNKRKTKCFK